jgi:hypothetical protein
LLGVNNTNLSLSAACFASFKQIFRLRICKLRKSFYFCTPNRQPGIGFCHSNRFTEKLKGQELHARRTCIAARATSAKS